MIGIAPVAADRLPGPLPDRDILVSYNSNGFISAITDFAERVIRYEYYDGTEPSGNFGDLKSVTTPVVIGTPNENDFPDGKTTTYTYSTYDANNNRVRIRIEGEVLDEIGDAANVRLSFFQ